MNARYPQIAGQVFVSLFLGATALAVAFVAPFLVETVGRTSKQEVMAPAVAIGLYLAFCQFWVSPRTGSGFGAKLLTLLALMAPVSVVGYKHIFVLAYAFAGCVAGAVVAHLTTATPCRSASVADSLNRRRRYVMASFILLAAVAALIAIGVIPSVAPNAKTGLNVGAARVFLGITLGFDLLAVAFLACSLWRPRVDNLFSKGTLGYAAFVGLFLGVLYALTSGVTKHESSLGITSILLVVCAAFALFTTALMIMTSISLDRARLFR